MESQRREENPNECLAGIIREGFRTVTGEVRRIGERMDEIDDDRTSHRQQLEKLMSRVEFIVTELQGVKDICDGLLQQSQGNSKKGMTDKDRDRLRISQSAELSFSYNFLCAVFGTVVPLLVDKIDAGATIYTDQGIYDLRGCRLLSAMMFAKQSNDKRDVFQSSTGKNNIELRFQVVMSLLRNIQKEKSGTGRTAEGSSSGRDSNAFNVWKENKYIPDKIIEEVVYGATGDGRNQPAGSIDGGARKRRKTDGNGGQLSKREISLAVSKVALTKVLGFLNKSREQVRHRFLVELGFALVLENDASINFEFPTHDIIRDMDVIPDTRVTNGNLRLEERKVVDDKNSEILIQFIAERKEMVVIIQYEVEISGCMAKRMIRRRINILEVALNTAIAFLQCTSRMVFLRRSCNSLRFVYAIASGILGIFKVQSGQTFEESVQDEFKQLGKAMLPSERICKRHLCEDVLTITNEKFDEQHLDQRSTAFEEDSGHGDEDDGNESYVEVFLDEED